VSMTPLLGSPQLAAFFIRYFLMLDFRIFSAAPSWPVTARPADEVNQGRSACRHVIVLNGPPEER
jgi:hypothetical protein